MFFRLVLADCGLWGAWQCTGGTSTYPIQSIHFGDDEDDDSLALFLQYDTCSVFQNGDYEVDGDTISVDLNGFLDRCETSNGPHCGCFDDFDLSISDDCLEITGPNGEHCEPISECNQFTCSDGSTPIENPYYIPTSNECGPESFPIGAPEFSFGECCVQHDYCYPICGQNKRECDYEFYECMACSCMAEYDNIISEQFCLLLACLYFEAVDTFGCDAYEASQENGCYCPTDSSSNAKSLDHRSVKVVDKFGGLHEYNNLIFMFAKGTLDVSDFFCEGPFDPVCE